SKNGGLRSYRITRSSTRGSITADSENSNDNSNTGSVVAVSQPTAPSDTTHDPQAQTPQRRTLTALPQLPVLKVELPKIGITAGKAGDQRKRSDDSTGTTVSADDNKHAAKDSDKSETTPAATVPLEGEDSRASPAVLLDPVTGLLEPVPHKKAFEHTAVIQAIKPQQHTSAATITTTSPLITGTTAGAVCQPSVSAVATNATTQPIGTGVITTPTMAPIPSVITSASIQDIPNISERIHGSTTAVKLKTGKPFNLPEVIDKQPVITSVSTATTSPSATIVPITPTTPAAIVTTPKDHMTSTITSAPIPPHPQPITITPKYPPPVGQPLAPIAQPMPSQWPQNLVAQQQQQQSRQFPAPTPHPSVLTQHQHRPPIPSITGYHESKQQKLPIDIIPGLQSTQSAVPQPPPAHSKLTLEPKAVPSMPTSVVTSHSSADSPLISPPIQHSKHDSSSARRDSLPGKPSAKYATAPGIQIAGYPTPAHEASAAHIQASSNRGVIEEMLQNNGHLLQQHQKEQLLASIHREQQREQHSRERSLTPAGHHESQALRSASQTPTSSAEGLIPPHMAGLHLRAPPSQSPALMGLNAAHLGLMPNDLQALMNEQMRQQMNQQMSQQMMFMHNNPYQGLPTDIRARQEAQGLVRAAMNMPPRFVYPSTNFQMPLTGADAKERERQQQQEERERQTMREKAVVVSARDKQQKDRESGRDSVSARMSQQEEVDFKASYQRAAEAEIKRQVESALSAMQPPPPLAPLRIPPGIPFPPGIRQFAPHMLSPHDRYTDSPAIVHAYAPGRPQSSHQLPPQLRAEELKQQEALRRSPVVKGMDDRSKYQSQPPPGVVADFSALHRQQLTSPSPHQYSMHSPGGALSYRKETTRSPMPPPSADPMDALRKQMMAQYQSQQNQVKDMQPSPSAMALNISQQMAAAGAHLQLPPHMAANEGLMRRSAVAGMHPIQQLGSEPPIHGPPPPAHAISQPPPHHQQSGPQHATAPQHGDSALLQRYPVMWQGLFALKNDQAAVQMHYVSGNSRIARDSLPPLTEGGVSPLKIAQRMRLEPQQLEGLSRKIQSLEEHCILLALPCGRDHMDVLQQSNNLKTGFITYLQSKHAAGIVNTNAPGSQEPAYVIHIFPTCEFSHENLVRIAPDLLHSLQEISHLLVVIATV
ncbi:unnamed protein product, partial [Oppiella nova]